MTTAAVTAWLPRNAIAAAAEQLAMREMVADWAAHWFARGGASLRGMEAVPAGQPLSGVAQAVDDSVIVALDSDASAAIAELMVGPIDDAATAADRAAIDAAVDQASDDLRIRAAKLLCLPASGAWQKLPDNKLPFAGYRFRVMLGGAALSIAVADRLLIAAVKARLRPAAPRGALDALATGLAPQPIAVSARLGAASLAMRELAALGPGDVVVLDRQLADPAMLAVDSAVRDAPCRVSAGDTHLELALI